jgi:hypothetical protein
MSITYKAIVVTNIAWWLVNVQNQLSKAYNTKKNRESQRKKKLKAATLYKKRYKERKVNN